MIISELIQAPTATRNSSFKGINEILTEYGFKSIGNGAFADVFSHENLPYVLKTFVKDSGYISFIDLVNSHKENPHFPKFRGKLIQITSQIYAIRMEWLSPFDPFTFPRNHIQAGLYNQERILRDNEPELGVSFPLMNQAKELLTKTMLNLSRRKNDPKFLNLDLHPGNIMTRGDTLVITDPFVDFNDVPNARRLKIR